jgi:hypothetical protein
VQQRYQCLGSLLQRMEPCLRKHARLQHLYWWRRDGRAGCGFVTTFAEPLAVRRCATWPNILGLLDREEQGSAPPVRECRGSGAGRPPLQRAAAVHRPTRTHACHATPPPSFPYAVAAYCRNGLLPPPRRCRSLRHSSTCHARESGGEEGQQGRNKRGGGRTRRLRLRPPGLASQCQAKGPHRSLEPTPTTRIVSARSPASLGLARANDMEPRAWKPPGLTAPKNGLPLAAAPRHPHPAKSALRVSSLVAYTVAGL